MKIDYFLFGNLLVFDTMYETNRYGMIYASCSCINHNANNVIVGRGFLTTEKGKSFIWLFNTFLRSMDGIAQDNNGISSLFSG